MAKKTKYFIKIIPVVDKQNTYIYFNKKKSVWDLADTCEVFIVSDEDIEIGDSVIDITLNKRYTFIKGFLHFKSLRKEVGLAPQKYINMLLKKKLKDLDEVRIIPSLVKKLFELQ